jgi:hypothetical protein
MNLTMQVTTITKEGTKITKIKTDIVHVVFLREVGTRGEANCIMNLTMQGHDDHEGRHKDHENKN